MAPASERGLSIGGDPDADSSASRRALAHLDVPGLPVDQFKLAFRNHPSGVAVITADAGNGPVGLTASSLFSVSVDPPLFVFSVSDQSSSTPTILRTDTLVAHLAGADDLAIARLCATSGVDRFADTSIWSRLPGGEPYFPSIKTWVRGRVVSTLDAGTATLVVIHALEASVSSDVESQESLDDAPPLVYHNRTWHRLGPSSRMD